jgi:hypothetical protein
VFIVELVLGPALPKLDLVVGSDGLKLENGELVIFGFSVVGLERLTEQVLNEGGFA